jgi:hypothetical protein
MTCGFSEKSSHQWFHLHTGAPMQGTHGQLGAASGRICIAMKGRPC